MTPARSVAAAALLLAAAAAAPAGAASHNCASDALAAAKSGPVSFYFPGACYRAAITDNGGASPADARLKSAATRDADRSLNGKITGVDLVKLGQPVKLKVTMTRKVKGLRVALERLKSGGGVAPVSITWLTGTTMLVQAHPTVKGTFRYRVNLGFVLDGKVIGDSTSPTLVIRVA
jgi:hypothetical protein